MPGSTPNWGTHAVKRRYSVAYSSGVNSPPQPHDSLPTPQNLTSYGLAIAGRGALLGQRVRARGRVAVLDPLVEVARRQAAQVGGEIGRAADQPAEPHELVSSRTHSGPASRGRRDCFASRARRSRSSSGVGRCARRADAVAPVVAVGETAARPADRAVRQTGACGR